jgi:hypothetical protein
MKLATMTFGDYAKIKIISISFSGGSSENARNLVSGSYVGRFNNRNGFQQPQVPDCGSIVSCAKWGVDTKDY